MNSNDRGSGLPRNVAQKLRAIRRRTAAVTLLRGFLLSLTLLFAAALIAMALDWAIGWFDPRVRFTVSGLAAAGAVAGLVWWCVRPLLRRRSIVSTAREVDASLPQLEERWSTVTELSQTQDTPERRGSEAMIARVAAEAESASAGIQPEAVVPAQPALMAARCLAVVVALLVLFFAFNFTSAALLFQRFSMPGKDVSLTQVQATPGDVWVARGEPLTLHAELKGRMPKASPKLYLRMPNGRSKEISMVGRKDQPGKFTHGLEDVSESFEYRVRAGDGQTPWRKITAVERPIISEVTFKVSPPAYSKLPVDEKNALPHAVRVLHGSDVEAGFRSDQPLDRFVLDFGNGNAARLTSSGDNWYRFRAVATNSFTMAAAAINKFKLESKTKPSCRISVYEDLPPSVKILEPSDDVAVLPGEKVDVVFEAADDLGLAKAEVIVSTTKADGTTNTFKLPVEMANAAGARNLKQSIQLDPKSLGLSHGDQLSYTVQVTDTKETPAVAAAKSQLAEQQVADAKEDSRAQNNSRESPANELAQANQPQAQPPAGNSAQRPPDDMKRRMLDAGQSAACKPRNISVDEWAGSYEGQKRKKLEIAIEPVLKQIDELLARAQEKIESLKQQVSEPPLVVAKDSVSGSRKLIDDLKDRTSGTPYAFVGLQLHNISEAHIVPAGLSLGRVASPSATNLVHLDSAAFHVTRARAMLADLTRTYESVKRDQQIAESMQKLNKMYQIFLEDTQALLGGGKGPINSYDRKIAEVDEAYVEKLRQMLEQKKEIMAELAKVLSEDPRMLRRYLAMMEQQADSLRDQMTLLAERQKQLQQQVSTWNATPETNRAALIIELKQTYAAQQKDLTADVTKLRENMETWLPLDIKSDRPEVQAALARAERAVQLTTTNGYEALKELRALRETIPQFSDLKSTNRARLTSYIANRLPEVERLITVQSGHMALTESLNGGEFPRVAEIVQHRVTQDTVALSSKLINVEEQVASMSEEIAAKAEMLNQIVEVDIIERQQKSVDQLAAQQMKPAETVLTNLPPAFALGEKTFDELLRLIIAKLDQTPAPSEPGEPQGLDSLLSMLEEEQKAAEGLGIPCRPLNVSVMRDWMRPGSNPGQGQGMAQAQAQAAQAQAQQGRDQAQRVERDARQSAATALAEAQKESAQAAAAKLQARGEAWNKLASRLQKDLLQGRDNTPPEQYRQAIESYFKVISETTRE